MVEIRWFVDTNIVPGTIAMPVSPTQAARLQYREAKTEDDAGFPNWGEWKDIPVVSEQPKSRLVLPN